MIPFPGPLRAVNEPEPESASTCSGCRRAAITPVGPVDLAELATWLLPELGDLPAPARSCRSCAPPARSLRWPALAAPTSPCSPATSLPATSPPPGDLVVTAAVDAWLEATGWRPAGPWCPECRGPHH